MHAVKALVRNGRLIVDEPTDLDDEERAELHAALDEGLADMKAGGGVDADEVLAALRAHR